MTTKSPRSQMRVGARLRLPSGSVVQLLEHFGSAAGAVWSCGYVDEFGLRSVGKDKRERVTLRHDWLLRYGRCTVIVTTQAVAA